MAPVCVVVELAGELLHAGGPGLGLHRQSPEQGFLLPGRKVRAQRRGRLERVLLQALHGGGRHGCRQAEIDRGREGVDIRLRPLPARLVLLDGGKAVLEQHAHGPAVLHGPGAAEVQELQGVVGHPHQVVGADVPVDHAGFVQLAQVPQKGAQHGQQELGRKAAAGLPALLLQRDAVQELHDEVGGVVRAEEVDHVDDGGQGVLAGQELGLLQEAVLRAGKHLVRAGLGLGAHAVRPALGALRGEALLDRHALARPDLPGDVGDAKSPLAEHGARGVGAQAAAAGQPRAQGKLLPLRLPGDGLAAVRTGRPGGRAHAMRAKIHLRRLPSE